MYFSAILTNCPFSTPTERQKSFGTLLFSSSSRRVKFPIACVLDALSEAKVGSHGKSVSLETLPFLVPRRLFPSNGPTGCNC